EGLLAEQYFLAGRKGAEGPAGPGGGGSADGAPADGGPADGASADRAPADRTPADRTPADGTPADARAADHWDLDCGSGADGWPRDWDAAGPPALSPWQARLLCRQVAQECVRHAREAG